MDSIYPLVSIITVSYNSDEVTADLLRSLQLVTYPRLEIIVVDNASVKDAGYLAKDFPQIQFIQNTINEGFAGGNNRGIAVSTGEIILLLNNDTEVEPGFLEPIVKLFQRDPGIGVISPKILYYYTGLIQYAGGARINPFTARGTFARSGEPDSNPGEPPFKTQLAHGAAMAIRRKVIDKIGALPEVYFLYYEELDYCEHALRAGFSIWCQPESVVLHKESMSVGKVSALKVYYQNRNRLLFIRRNIPGIIGLISRLFFTLVSLPVGMLRFLLSSQPRYAAEVWKGFIWNLKYRS